MIVTYRERRFIDKYSCVDNVRKIHATSMFQPEGTDCIYFKLNKFEVKVICADDIISIED